MSDASVGRGAVLEVEDMSDDNHELSDEEYDALLSDLEGRASEGGAKKSVDVDDDLGDIDEFLADLDTGDASPAAATTTTGENEDDLAREFAALEEKGELSAPKKENKKGAKEKKGKKRGKKREDQKGEGTGQQKEQKPSRARRMGLATAKSVLWFTPALILWWVLGAYLGQWISAGWLIAIVAAAFVFAIPLVLKRWVKRGTYRPWLLGTSLVMTVALIAPIPNMAGENLSSYGHWPASMAAEVTGADEDAAFVRSTASATASLGTWIATVDDPGWQARQLGTGFPLGMEWPQEELVPLLEQGEIEAGELEEALEEMVGE